MLFVIVEAEQKMGGRGNLQVDMEGEPSQSVRKDVLIVPYINNVRGANI